MYHDSRISGSFCQEPHPSRCRRGLTTSSAAFTTLTEEAKLSADSPPSYGEESKGYCCLACYGGVVLSSPPGGCLPGLDCFLANLDVWRKLLPPRLFPPGRPFLRWPLTYVRYQMGDVALNVIAACGNLSADMFLERTVVAGRSCKGGRTNGCNAELVCVRVQAGKGCRLTMMSYLRTAPWGFVVFAC